MAQLYIDGVRLPSTDPELFSRLYDVVCADGVIASIVEHDSDEAAMRDQSVQSSSLDARGCLLIPAPCHIHIHLDKCYLLDRCELITGGFKEALQVTSKAKEALSSNTEDMYNRGKRLILESLEAGVTLMRAHVEVDKTGLCDIQIAAFAQDPLYDESGHSGGPGDNWGFLTAAAARPEVEVVGSAPYVESTTERAKQNIIHILHLAHTHHLHADLHLDYTLDASTEPLVWFLLDALRTRVRDGRWARDRSVCIGHATRLSLFSAREWARFAAEVAADALPVSLVGLPQSDVYMRGRQLTPGTLDPVRLKDAHAVRVALAVNNVGNAFTPQGAPDPLALCPLGVALFQAATKTACQTLLESVTVTARVGIGRPLASASLVPQVGDPADLLLLHDNYDVQSAVCNPSYTRTTIKAGRVVARRERRTWFFNTNTNTNPSGSETSNPLPGP